MVRLATERDLPEVLAIHRQVHALHVANRPDIYRMPEDDDALFSVFLSGLKRPESYLFVVETEVPPSCSGQDAVPSAEIVGYAVVRYRHPGEMCIASKRTGAFIDDFGIDEKHRRHGYGRELMNAVVAHAKEHHADDLSLNVWAFNHDAARFYQSLGMTPRQQTLELQL